MLGDKKTRCSSGTPELQQKSDLDNKEVCTAGSRQLNQKQTVRGDTVWIFQGHKPIQQATTLDNEVQAKKGPRPAPEHQQHRLVGLKKLERLTSQPLLFLRLGGQPQKLEKEAKAGATRMFTTVLTTTLHTANRKAKESRSRLR